MDQNSDMTMEQKILDTAEDLFLDKGFAMTSTTEIAKKAGCNQALVHYYFRTKERLFESIFEKKLGPFIRSFLQICTEDISFEEKLARTIRAHYEVVSQNPRFPFLVLNELTTNPSRIKSIKEMLGDAPVQAMKRFQAELDEEIRQGRIRPVTAFDLLLTMLSLNIAPFLYTPMMRDILDFSPADLQEILRKRIDENVTVILKSLKP